MKSLKSLTERSKALVRGVVSNSIDPQEGSTMHKMHKMRWPVLGLIAVAAVLGLTASAYQAQPAQPVTQIKIVPEKPTVNDEIKVELSGTFPDFCAPDAAEAQVELNQVTILASNVSQFCAEGETKWSLSVPVGKKLEAGPYRVLVLFRMTKEPPDFLLGMARFDVVERRAQNSSSDQTGRQAQPAIAPFTILPVIQTLGSIPFVGGALAVNNLNSSKANLNRQALPVPFTVGVPIGDVVEINNLNSSKANLYRIAGCKAEQDVQIVDNCIPPFPRDKPTKVLITGPDPRLVLDLEQTELPDLAVNIMANVRRYTEREQVFCDVTVLTRVTNIGKGPAGPVLLANNLNSSKANFKRYGMGTDGQATNVDVLSRLRPGSYPLEAEVQSLSIKESNLNNNKATQVVTCR